MKQRLNIFDFTMIVVGLVIGMGIFRTASTSAKAANDPAIFFTAWLIGGLVAFCGALTYAEIGSRYPVTGGYYRIFSYAYHPSIAFSINCIILISNAASLSGVALIGAGYLSRIILHDNATDTVKALVAIGAIVVFYFCKPCRFKAKRKNAKRVDDNKNKYDCFADCCTFFPSIHYKGAVDSSAKPTGFTAWIKALGAALVAVSFTYGGYQQTINFGQEVQEPKKIFRAEFFRTLL